MIDDDWFARPGARAMRCSPAPDEVLAFHRSLPGYAPTPLVELPSLAAELGLGRLVLKDESSRLGLPAFKVLGASWAIHRALAERALAGQEADPALPDPALAGQATAAPVLLVTATDGNHGRAVARTARQLGHRAAVVVPRGVHPAAVQAIRDEGATVTEVDGDYDHAVAQAQLLAGREPGGLLVQDTSLPGYETVPGWIVQGYSTLLREVDAQLETQVNGELDASFGAAVDTRFGAAVDTPFGGAAADLVVVPVGVGSLAQAVVQHYRSGTATPALMAVEPRTAACVLASLRAGEPVSVPTGVTVMAGLNCGTVSGLAWPYLAAGLDAAVAVSDDASLATVADLAALGVAAGPCGAATLAGLRAALSGPGAADRRAALGLDQRPDPVVVLLSTEGAAANPSGQQPE